MSNGLDALREMVDLTFKYDDNLINKMADLSNIVLQDLERLEKLEYVIECLKRIILSTYECKVGENNNLEFVKKNITKTPNIQTNDLEIFNLVKEVFGE